MTGTPRVAGTFAVTIRVEDAAGASLAEPISVPILDDPSLSTRALLGALVGAEALGAETTTYIDRSGNADGSLDLGDLRAFVRRQPIG